MGKGQVQSYQVEIRMHPDLFIMYAFSKNYSNPLIELSPIFQTEYTPEDWDNIARYNYWCGKNDLCGALALGFSRACVREEDHSGPHVCCQGPTLPLLIWE